MADVSKIQGPSGPPDNLGKKEKSAAEADKFQEAMRKRVTEVSQIDPDEQKKRKRQEEAEEEEQTAPQESPTTPAALVTPFSLEQEAKKASPLDLQKEGPGISPMEASKLTQTQIPTTSKAAFYQAPASDEMEDDSALLEEESFGDNASTPSSPSIQEPQRTQWRPEGGQPVTPGPPESDRLMTQQMPTSLPQEKKETAPGDASKTEPAHKEDQQKQAALAQKKTAPSKAPQGFTSSSLEEAEASKEHDTSGFFEQMVKEQKGEKESKTSEEAQEAALEGAAPTLPQAPSVQVREEMGNKKIEEEKEMSLAETIGLPLTPTEATLTPSAPEALPPYANIHPQVQELFERMVGVMTVMNMSGMTETIMTLNSPQFASSVFFGTQIIIQEFSTAPQAFNIQLNGTPQAVALFQGNADDLMAAFQAGNYNFRVNRLETGYLTERPLFKRKEKASGGKQDQTGDNP